MTRRLGMLAGLALCLAVLTGCGPATPDATGGSSTQAPRPSPSVNTSPSPSSTPAPSSTPVAMPTDCNALLTPGILAQLADSPLDQSASGTQSDGSLQCFWQNPGADATGITTKISRMDRGPALDMLNKLVTDEAYTCYTPSGGTRYEKTWRHDHYPVDVGRTLFWRDGILIDTRWSNLAPAGFTAAIIASIWH